MATPNVYFVHLRRPDRSNRDEKRDDPFYEFGSFGCTGCHSSNLLHPHNAERLKKLRGARLAFVQGGSCGSRLVFLTPPIKEVIEWPDRCEAIWVPIKKPFKYAQAPILVSNDGCSHFPKIKKFALELGGTTIEGKLTSRLRSRATELPPDLANHVIEVYERMRADAKPSDFASKYYEALPYLPPCPDDNRIATYRNFLRGLSGGKQSRCGSRRRHSLACRKKSTNRSDLDV